MPGLQNAHDFLIKAAEQGHAEAQYELGMRHLNEKGFPKDFDKAIAWLTLADEQGHTKAHFALGDAYIEALKAERSNNRESCVRRISANYYACEAYVDASACSMGG